MLRSYLQNIVPPLGHGENTHVIWTDQYFALTVDGQAEACVRHYELEHRLSMSSTTDSEAAFEELPAAYVRWRASRLGRITDALEEQLILELTGPIADVDVLDVGCGDGQLAIALVDAGAHVAAVDPDPRMLAAALNRFKKAGASVHLAEATAEKLPFENDRFDIVMAITVTCFLREPVSAITEMARVLKPGGRLVIGDLARHSLWAAWRRFIGWLGHPTWRAAHFRSANDLVQLAHNANLEPTITRAAIFYPPLGYAAVLLSRLDRWLSRRLVFGGAFLVLVATKPAK